MLIFRKKEQKARKRNRKALNSLKSSLLVLKQQGNDKEIENLARKLCADFADQQSEK